MSENKTKKCTFKCGTCENYDKVSDYCKEKKIENCSRQVNTDFSACKDYLVNEKLVMF